ncbi:MAG: GTP-binding protein TypA/BipA [Gammaproteobacteria bacterium]|nr:GTP-binding protein TypA/BipA [Gammaproteobacteria bacterium]
MDTPGHADFGGEEDRHQGAVMERLGDRRGELRDLVPDGRGRVRLDFLIPARGLIGFQTEFRTMTAGSGIMHHIFDRYGRHVPGAIGSRPSGVLISNATGKTVAYALFNLQERGKMFVGPGEKVYAGQIVGKHVRPNDLTVNPMKGKQLSNVRAAGKDDNVLLAPPVRLTLEQALEFIDDEELVEITPKAIRLRKEHLAESRRKQEARKQA